MVHAPRESARCCEWCKNAGSCKVSGYQENCCPECDFYLDCPGPWHRTEFMTEQLAELQTA